MTDPAPSHTPSPVLRQHISVPKAARLLDVDARVIYGLVKRGELPALHVGRAIRIAVEDLETAFRTNLGARQRPRPGVATAPPRARRPKGTFTRLARGMNEGRETATPDGAS